MVDAFTAAMDAVPRRIACLRLEGVKKRDRMTAMTRERAQDSKNGLDICARVCRIAYVARRVF